MIQSPDLSVSGKDPALLERRVQSLIGERRFDAARDAAEQLQADHPTRVGGWILGAHVEHHSGDFGQMMVLALKAEKVAPDRDDVQFLLVDAETVSGNISEALHRMDKLQTQLSDGAYEWQLLSSKYFQLGRFRRAYDTAARGTTGNLALKAVAAMALGQLGEAEALYDQVIDTSCGEADAYYSRAILRPHDKPDVPLAQTCQRLDREPDDTPASVPLHYALAKMLEDQGEHAASFAHLSTGAATRRRHLSYDVTTDELAIRQIIDTFDMSWFEHSTSSPVQHHPIFVMGLPRTGTTLIDRILGSHSQVASIGEVNDLAYSVMRATGQSRDKNSRIAGAAAADMEALGGGYMKAVRGYGVNAPYLIDKTPANFLYIGLIAKALPGARIIHLRRHPMASGYAMFKTLFRMGYPFSYDLDDLGRYIAAYHLLMAHWRRVVPGLVFDVDYESLVNDQEAATRSLLEYCDLEWEDQCLAFHKNSAPTATASAAQVRQPIYTHSENLWKAYESELEPLRAALAKAGVPL